MNTLKGSTYDDGRRADSERLAALSAPNTKVAARRVDGKVTHADEEPGDSKAPPMR